MVEKLGPILDGSMVYGAAVRPLAVWSCGPAYWSGPSLHSL